MTIYSRLIFILWLALIAYWAKSGLAMRRNIGSRWIWWREIALRLGFFALVILALQVAAVDHALPNARPYVLNTSVPLGLSGLVLCMLGMGLAVTGRAYLEPNWSTPISDRTNPELITTGPFALIRHPIYSGMLLAVLGSAIGQSVLWLIPLIVYGPHFVLSARREEQALLARYPQRYRDYMTRTKMLVPYVI